MAKFGTGYRFHVTGLAHDETGFPTNDPAKIAELLDRLHRKVSRFEDQIIEVDVDLVEGAKIGVFAYGSTARSALRAARHCREAGLPISTVSPTTIWPFPTDAVRQLAEQVDTILVPEMNLGQMAHEVEWAARGKATIEGYFRANGEPISPHELEEKLRTMGGLS